MWITLHLENLTSYNDVFEHFYDSWWQLRTFLMLLSSWFKPSGYSVFSFRIQKISCLFGSSRNCSVVWKVFEICSFRLNLASLWKIWFWFWKFLQARIRFVFLLSFLWLFNIILKEVSFSLTCCIWQTQLCNK